MDDEQKKELANMETTASVPDLAETREVGQVAGQTVPNCQLCGEQMPVGEEMFKFHGYSGPCPKPPIPPVRRGNLSDDVLRDMWQSVSGPQAELNGPLIRFAGLVYRAVIDGGQ